MNQGPGVYQILGLSGESKHVIIRTTEFAMFALHQNLSCILMMLVELIYDQITQNNLV